MAISKSCLSLYILVSLSLVYNVKTTKYSIFNGHSGPNSYNATVSPCDVQDSHHPSKRRTSDNSFLLGEKTFDKRNKTISNMDLLLKRIKVREGEGLVVFALNSQATKITFEKVFPLGKLSKHFLDLIFHVESLQTGSLVVMVISASGVIGLRDAATVLKHFGSVLSEHLHATSHWIWVFIKGGKTLIESGVLKNQNSVFVDSIFAIANSITRWNSTFEEKEKWQLCDNVNGFGDLCEKRNVTDVISKPLELTYSELLKDIPVIVTGGNRIQYLYRTIKSLFNSPGFKRENLKVYLGDTNEYVKKLLKLLDIDFIDIPVDGKGNSKLFQYYRLVFKHIYTNHSLAPAVIILDEDVEVAPDFFSLMNQMIPLLIEDESLYCVSGFSTITNGQTKGRLDKILRVVSQPVWGFALTTQLIEEALKIWPKGRNLEVQFDYWMYEQLRNDRECLVPEVSRTNHFGIGVNSVGTGWNSHYSLTELPSKYGVNISNLHDLKLKDYKKFISRELESSSVLRGNPCDADFLSKLPDGPHVFYYVLKTDNDGYYSIVNYFWIGQCVGFFSGLEVGWHDYVTVFPVAENTTIYFMGIPMSSYSHLAKISIEEAWDINTLSQENSMEIDKRIHMEEIEFYERNYQKYEQDDSIGAIFS